MSIQSQEQDGSLNWSFTEIILKKTGDKESDRAVKKFYKETLAFLKKIRSDYKEYLEFMAKLFISQGMIKEEDSDVSGEMVDEAIKYTFNEYKSEKVITCLMDFDKITLMYDNRPLSMPIEEARKKGLADINGMTELTDEMKELFSKNDIEEFMDFHSVFSEDDLKAYGIEPKDSELFTDAIKDFGVYKEMYFYFDKLGIYRNDPYECETVNYMNPLYFAADNFSEKYGHDVFIQKCLVSVDGKVHFLGYGEEILKNEFTVDKNYFTDADNEKWYPNIREICVKIFMPDSDENGVKTKVMPLEHTATFYVAKQSFNDVIKIIERLCEDVKYNIRTALNCGYEMEDIPPEYFPYIYLNGERVQIDNLMIFSEDFELVEIPFFIDEENQMVFTKYL